MSRRATSPSTLRIREILADGHWHRRDELVVKAGALIQPGVALRARERARKRLLERSLRDGKKPGGRPDRSHEYSIAIGRRMLIVDALNGLSGIEQRKDDDGIRWVRDIQPAPKEAHHQ